MAAALRTLLRHRPEGTTCPSEVARIVGGEAWRPLTPVVRDLAWDLADQRTGPGAQRGAAVGRGVRGPVRIGRGPAFPE